MFRINNNSKGFTLVELLVVIAIIGILSSVVLVSVGSARAKARDSRRIADMKAIQAAIELYKSRSLAASAPTEALGLADLVTRGFLPSVPTNPKVTAGNPEYDYSNSLDGDNETFYVSFTTESGSSVSATAGLMCATSTTMEPAVSGSCTEK